MDYKADAKDYRTGSDHLDDGRELRARPRRQAGSRLRADLGRLARRLARLPPHQVRGSALRHGHLAAGRRDQRRRMGGDPQVDPARAGGLLRDDRLPALPRHQRAARGGPARARGVSLARPLRHLGVRRRSDPGDDPARVLQVRPRGDAVRADGSGRAWRTVRAGEVHGRVREDLLRLHRVAGVSRCDAGQAGRYRGRFRQGGHRRVRRVLRLDPAEPGGSREREDRVPLAADVRAPAPPALQALLPRNQGALRQEEPERQAPVPLLRRDPRALHARARR